MAKIRTYDSQIAATGQLAIPRQSGEAFGAGVGRSIAKVGQQLKEVAERNSAFEAENKTAQLRTDFTQEFQNLKDTAEPGAEGFVTSATDRFDEFSSGVNLDGLTARGRQQFQGNVSAMRANFAVNAIAFEGMEKGRFRRQQVEQKLEDGVNLVRSDPTQAELIKTQGERLIDMLVLNGKDRSTLTKNNNESVAFAEINGILDGVETVEGAQDVITEMTTKDHFQAELSEPGFRQALRRARALKDHLGAKEKTEVLDAVLDGIAAMEKGVGLDRKAGLISQVRAVITDKKKQDKMVSRLDRAQLLGEKMVVLNSASPQDVMSMRNELKTGREKEGEFRAASRDVVLFQSALAERQRRLTQDPADLILETNINIKSQYEAFSAVRFSDETSLEQKVILAGDYIRSMKTEQKRLGLSPTEVKPVPARYVKAVASALQNVERTVTGAQQAFKLLQAEGATWGREWPTVAAQLIREKAITGNAAVAAQMLDLDQRVAGQTLMKADAIGFKQLKKEVDIKDLESQLHRETTDALAALKDTLDPQVGGSNWYARYQEAVKTSAAYYVSRGEANIATAVANAADEIINLKYEFFGTYRVPRGLDMRHISIGVVDFLDTIETQDLVIPKSLVPGMRVEDIKRDMIAALKNSAIWVTNEDETGLQLAWQEDNGDTSFVSVIGPDGIEVPYVVTWDQLIQRGRNTGVAGADFGLGDE